MSASSQQPRLQLVAGAADMIRRRGLNATSIREVAKHAQAPLGSTYHYFPGGKRQLAGEAVRFAGETVSELLRKNLDAGPVEGLRALLDLWREILTGTDFQAGCPVLAVSVEEQDDEGAEVRAAAAEVFGGWESLLADSLRQHGCDAERAPQLATLVVSAFEGAVVMCRAQRSTRALDHVGERLEALIAAEV
ncbi:TetR family transcriptional regulator [Saccharopolyspora erythraea NRRL 2338]|uniref:TetR-family transcriptional regulator n=2 Tax=Saccharopolyspora erythraea TaxID=1836 RepID=A4FDV0_SACEN|nr:helix-turn-helix domain-containing protein [Saccharopolyspora erythraea]EQD84712.1 TetR family transcriptional regulator [Saccharopolyspora erythraea D]PFG95957.1 TetR family transcriptional regulator [Saccharopolyspora erythraea NRRL 2338]QRK92522.1 TetR/AcrR family transcriptional regulator [Saccharopolyspora erythraea]CAM02225.1 TetR-family transcriptional regulator [Saccharopolyspora erythraea NRRL 2338]